MDLSYTDPARGPLVITSDRDQLELVTAALVFAVEQLGGSLTFPGYELEQLRHDLRTGKGNHLEVTVVRDPYTVIFRSPKESE